MADLVYWYLSEIPQLILRAGRGYLRRVYFGFSLPTLTRTMLAPWRRDVEAPSDPSVGGRLRAAVDNLVSRLFGAVVRFVTLVAGLALTVTVAVCAGVAWLGWLGLPFVIVVLVGGGLRLMIAGGL